MGGRRSRGANAFGSGVGKKARQEPRPPRLTAERGAKKEPWPKARAERTKAVQAALSATTVPISPADLAKQFTRGNPEQIEEILEALASLGLVRKARGGKYAAEK